jgi:hypothetical protein
MNRWRHTRACRSGVACTVAILALAQLADEVSAKLFAVAEAQPVAAEFDWREVPRARAVRIPDGPAPDIEVRVGRITDEQRVAQGGLDALWGDERTTGAQRGASGPDRVGVSYSEGNGFSFPSASTRFGEKPEDPKLRVQDAFDYGLPVEHAWADVIGSIRLSQWPIVPGRPRIAFAFEGRLDSAPHSSSGVFVVPK